MSSLVSRSKYIVLGTSFVSSLGSSLFFICLMATLVTKQVSVFEASLLIGMPRLLGLFVQIFLGSQIDSWGSKKVILISEFGAGICSVALFLVWPNFDNQIYPFLVFLSLRTGFSTLQSGAKSRLMRIFSGDDEFANTKTAVALNQAIHGTFLISALASLLLIKVDLRYLIAFDFLSFIVGGVGILFIKEDRVNTLADDAKRKWSVGLASLFEKKLRFVTSIDMLLALSFAGLSVYIFRLASGDAESVSILNVAYGLGVWSSGYLIGKRLLFKKSHILLFFLSLTFCALGYFSEIKHVMLVISFFLFTLYWLQFHLVTAKLQSEASLSIVGSTMAARNAVMVGILVTGEFCFGYFSKFIDVQSESLLRACVALLAAILFAVIVRQK